MPPESIEVTVANVSVAVNVFVGDEPQDENERLTQLDDDLNVLVSAAVEQQLGYEGDRPHLVALAGLDEAEAFQRLLAREGEAIRAERSQAARAALERWADW